MRSYNTKEWYKPILEFHKADTFRKLFWILIFVGIYTALINYVEIRYLKLNQNSNIKNITLMHSLLGFAISMLLVFRTNTAYDRWWEGRKLWGNLINNSRNLAIKLNAILHKNDKSNKVYFKQLIGNFPLTLQRHLQLEQTRLELDEEPHPELPDFDTKKHLPLQLSNAIQRKIFELNTAGVITDSQLIVLNPELSALMEICGACERIKNTPIPYSYSAFIKKFIFIYVLTLPMGFVFQLGYLAVPVVIFIFYVLASLEVIAEEIEDPFGYDSNDLPMIKLSNTIKKNVEDILG
jgi:ion channel-forming bestrophin family protein